MAPEIHVPAVYDKDRAATELMQRVFARWKAVRPKDYAAWNQYCNEYRKGLTDRGWSNETRDLKVTCLMAPYVQWVVARIVGDPSWNFRDETLMNAYLRECPAARMDADLGTARSSVFNQADKDRKWM